MIGKFGMQPGGNYWEGSVKDVITQEELDAFTTKITLNGKTLQQYMSMPRDVIVIIAIELTSMLQSSRNGNAGSN